MKAVAIVEFDDLKEGLRRLVGDVFDVTEERFADINATGMAKIGKNLVAEAEVEQAKSEKKPAKRAAKKGGKK